MANKRQSDNNPQERNGPKSNQSQSLSTGRMMSGLPFSGSHPFGLLRRFANEVDDLFGDFGFGRSSLWNRPGLYSTSFDAGWPQIDMFERNGEFVIRADVPGLQKDDLHVEVTDDTLIISGERTDEREDKGEFYRSERSYGSFERRIALPEGANADDVSCTFNNGILEIRMKAPEQQAKRARRVEIQEKQEKGSLDKPEKAA